MVQDRYFYDPVAQQYTVDRYLDDLEKRYGGIDAVLIWPTYPNMGIDNRNQHDMIRSMPGGVAGVRQMIADFHKRGVRVLFPMMMWDQGTRDHGQIVARCDCGADGGNRRGRNQWRHAGWRAAGVFAGGGQDRTSAGVRAGGRAFGRSAGLERDDVGAVSITDSFRCVDKYKWLEPRHMVNISDRWNRDKTDDLAVRVFQWRRLGKLGEHLGHLERDHAARCGSHAANRDDRARHWRRFCISKDWEPLAPMLRYGVFASRWPSGQQTLWTIVNRNEYDVEGPQNRSCRGRWCALFRPLSRRRVDAGKESRRVRTCSALPSRPTDTERFLRLIRRPTPAFRR